MNAKRTRNYYDMFTIMFNSQKSYRKYIENTHLGLFTETHEYYFGSLNTKYSYIQDGGTHRRPFPPDHIVDLEEAAMGWVLRLRATELV